MISEAILLFCNMYNSFLRSLMDQEGNIGSCFCVMVKLNRVSPTAFQQVDDSHPSALSGLLNSTLTIAEQSN